MKVGRKQKRMVFIGGLFAAAALAAGLILVALNDNIVFFVSPSDLLAKHVSPEQKVRLGGLVEKGSVQRDGEAIHFTVTDGNQSLLVVFRGALPDLFREGQGVVAEGRLRENIFRADTILAKHDENYMPRDVADALKKQGYWHGGRLDKMPQKK